MRIAKEKNLDLCKVIDDAAKDEVEVIRQYVEKGKTENIRTEVYRMVDFIKLAEACREIKEKK